MPRKGPTAANGCFARAPRLTCPPHPGRRDSPCRGTRPAAGEAHTNHSSRMAKAACAVSEATHTLQCVPTGPRPVPHERLARGRAHASVEPPPLPEIARIATARAALRNRRRRRLRRWWARRAFVNDAAFHIDDKRPWRRGARIHDIRGPLMRATARQAARRHRRERSSSDGISPMSMEGAVVSAACAIFLCHARTHAHTHTRVLRSRPGISALCTAPRQQPLFPGDVAARVACVLATARAGRELCVMTACMRRCGKVLARAYVCYRCGA